MKMITEGFIYHFFRYFVSIGLRFYHKDITVIGLDKFPGNNPIITASNHPTGLMDVFLVLYHVKKQIKFTAAGGLFKNKLQAAFLTSAGAIPLYRRKDNPDEMDKNVESFENCYQELESCGAIGFYPEGTSHPEPWVNQIKTGTARIALQAEDRNTFNLNLKVVPIGINSLKPGAFRGSVFVKFGNPISVKKYKDQHRKNSVEAVEQLTAEIQEEMENCTFHIKDSTLLNLFEDLKIIGIEDLKFDHQNLNKRAAQYYIITKILNDKIGLDGKKTATTKLNSLADKTGEFKQQMQQLGLTGHPFNGIKTFFRFFYFFIISLLGLPLALMAAIGNILPFILAKNLGRKIAGNDISLIPAARLMSGLVIYFLYYSVLFFVVWIFLNIGISLAVILFLIGGAYLALWYWEFLKTFILESRKIYYWLTNNKMIRELIRMREKILNELNSFLDLS